MTNIFLFSNLHDKVIHCIYLVVEVFIDLQTILVGQLLNVEYKNLIH